jgi:hypothetical protein
VPRGHNNRHTSTNQVRDNDGRDIIITNAAKNGCNDVSEQNHNARAVYNERGFDDLWHHGSGRATIDPSNLHERYTGGYIYVQDWNS